MPLINARLRKRLANTLGPDITNSAFAISSSGNGGSPGNAFDNSTASSWGSTETGSNTGGNSYIGQDFGSGNAKTIRGFKFDQANGASSNGTVTGFSSISLEYSDNGSSWTNGYTLGSTEMGDYTTPGPVVTIPDVGAHRYWRFKAFSNVNGSPGAVSWGVREIEMYEME